MKASLVVAFLFILFFPSYSRIVGTNMDIIYFNATRTNPVCVFFGDIRARTNGYGFFAVSNSKVDFQDAIVFMMYMTPDSMVLKRLFGRTNSTNPLTNNVWENLTAYDNLYVRRRDENNYPISRIQNGFKFRVFLNQTLLNQKYGTKFWLVFGTVNEGVPTNNNFSINPAELNSFLYDTTLNYFYLQAALYNLRLESIHLSYFIISLVFLVFIFFLLIPFAKQQPLLSRSATPFLACIIHFILLFVDFPVFFLNLNQLYSYCLVDFMLQKPAVLSIIFLSLIHFFRYVIISNLGKRKNAIVSDKEEDKGEIKLGFRILKVLGAWWVNVLTVIFFFIIMSLIELIIFFINGLRCDDIYPNVVFYNVMIGVLVFLFLCVIIYDLIINFSFIKNCQCNLFWKNDIFYYRFEIYIIGFAITFVVYIVATILSAVFLQVYPLNSSIIEATATSISYVFLFYFQVLFPLSLTIIQLIRKWVSPAVQSDDITVFLADPVGYEIFKTFSQAEYSIENISCYDDIQLFKNLTNPEQMHQKGTEIYYKYLNGGNSSLEVNIPMKNCIEVKSKLNLTGHMVSDLVDKSLFNDVEKGIMLNLSDTWSRLILTPEYKVYKKQMNFVQGSMGN